MRSGCRSAAASWAPPLLLLVAALPAAAKDEPITLADDPFEITDVNTTKIIDIFPFNDDEQRNLRPLSEVVTEPETV